MVTSGGAVATVAETVVASATPIANLPPVPFSMDQGDPPFISFLRLGS